MQSANLCMNNPIGNQEKKQYCHVIKAFYSVDITILICSPMLRHGIIYPAAWSHCAIFIGTLKICRAGERNIDVTTLFIRKFFKNILPIKFSITYFNFAKKFKECITKIDANEKKPLKIF